ncbi:MAG: hypothetical protein ACKORJ_13315 [Bacteroidota bacterium]
MTSYKRKSWVEKRDTGRKPVIKVLQTDFADMRKGQRMLIPTPQLVDAYIRHIRKGKTGSLVSMRRDLAAEHHADVCCPVTSGIFVRIAAEAAWEELQEGKPEKAITPFWRMIGPGSPAFSKLTFGTDYLIRQRHKEHLDT